eukprot:5141673-Pyramimonas_sp.AAC.1
MEAEQAEHARAAAERPDLAAGGRVAGRLQRAHLPGAGAPRRRLGRPPPRRGRDGQEPPLACSQQGR